MTVSRTKRADALTKQDMQALRGGRMRPAGNARRRDAEIREVATMLLDLPNATVARIANAVEVCALRAWR